MQVFKDNKDRIWQIEIDVYQIKRVKAATGVDLLTLFEDKLQPLGNLLADAVKLVEVIYTLCEEAATARGVTDEHFARGMRGDVLQHAAHAFIEELTDFFPDAKARGNLKKIVSKGRQIQDLANQRLDLELEKVDVAERLDDLFKSNGPSGDSPESSGLTPIP